MKRTKFTLGTLAAVTLAVGMTASPMLVPMANAQVTFQLGWQQPPQEFNDVQRQGYQAGIEAARHDLDFRLSPDPHRHWDYRSPHVPSPARDDFRHSFGRGYEMAYQHRGEWNHDHHDWDHHDGDRDHHDGDHDNNGYPHQ
ncbi:MAG: hypothetical protein ABR971_04145 [Acidobacteriaceae bacterium]|jgi:hypothetical protein